MEINGIHILNHTTVLAVSNINVAYFKSLFNISNTPVICNHGLPPHSADPGVASSIPARSHTFVEIDHEIISTVILLPSVESFKKGCCQLQAKVCARSTGKLLLQACPGKSVVR